VFTTDKSLVSRTYDLHKLRAIPNITVVAIVIFLKDKKGSRLAGSRTHELPIDEKLRKKKKYHKKKVEVYVPLRKAAGKNEVNHDTEQEYSFKSNYQREMLCAGQTFRVCLHLLGEKTNDLGNLSDDLGHVY
jgi:hypothetical protein